MCEPMLGEVESDFPTIFQALEEEAREEDSPQAIPPDLNTG